MKKGVALHTLGSNQKKCSGDLKNPSRPNFVEFFWCPLARELKREPKELAPPP
jgi:hypothetical protein